jgi:hypothetical protein
MRKATWLITLVAALSAVTLGAALGLGACSSTSSDNCTTDGGADGGTECVPTTSGGGW